MIFKTNMIVVLTNGRLAGKKAVVLKELDEQNILVAGVARTPVETEEFAPSWQKRRNAKFLTFIKKVNVSHALATRYKADIGLSNLNVDGDISDLETKKKINNEANTLMKSAFESNKSKWLFTSLNF